MDECEGFYLIRGMLIDFSLRQNKVRHTRLQKTLCNIYSDIFSSGGM